MLRMNIFQYIAHNYLDTTKYKTLPSINVFVTSPKVVMFCQWHGNILSGYHFVGFELVYALRICYISSYAKLMTHHKKVKTNHIDWITLT